MAAPALDGTIAVSDTTLGTTVRMSPLDALFATSKFPARFSVLDPLLPAVTLSPAASYPPFLGVFTIANLPTLMPPNLGGGQIPVGATAVVSNGNATPLNGTVPSATGAVVCEVIWTGTNWVYG